MKTRKVDLEKLFKIYDHPAAVLFRAIELNAIYKLTKDIEFSNASLDLGCGDGVISELLFDKRFMYGVDNGEANDVDIAIQNNRYQKTLLESAEKMSLKDNSVDFVFSNSVIEHIPNNEAVLSEISRILKPNGYLLFSSPTKMFGKFLFVTNLLNKLGLHFLANLYERKRNKMLNHYHILDYETYKKRLEKHGLKIERYTYCVSKETLKLWDIITVISYICKLLKFNINKILTTSLRSLIQNKVDTDSNNTKTGTLQGNLIILARKSK